LTKLLQISILITLIVSIKTSGLGFWEVTCSAVYLIHWPIALNPNGNHPIFPLLPDGKRDVDRSWKLTDTWKQMEAVVEKGTLSRHGKSLTLSFIS
jgi:diketogulonate reductase-like aldo/keto reductase